MSARRAMFGNDFPCCAPDTAPADVDGLRRLLAQTTAALNVALAHADGTLPNGPDKAAELAGCRAALDAATAELDNAGA